MLLNGDVGRLEELASVSPDDRIVLFTKDNFGKLGVLARIAVSLLRPGLRRVRTSVDSTYFVVDTDDLIECTANTFDVTLPDATKLADKEFDVLNVGGGTITAKTVLSQTIAGASTKSIPSQQNVTFYSNGVNWFIL